MIFLYVFPYCYFFLFVFRCTGIFLICGSSTSRRFINSAFFVLVFVVFKRDGTTGLSLKLSCSVSRWDTSDSLPTQIIKPSGCGTGFISKMQMHRLSRHSVWLTRASHCSWKKQDSFTFAAAKSHFFISINYQNIYVRTSNTYNNREMEILSVKSRTQHVPKIEHIKWCIKTLQWLSKYIFEISAITILFRLHKIILLMIQKFSRIIHAD